MKRSESVEAGWAAPNVFASMKHGSHRFCVASRELHKVKESQFYGIRKKHKGMDKP